jgi:hypothetical protein
MKWVRDKGLTLALMALFIVSVVGQGWAGWLAETEQQTLHGETAPQLMEYLISGAFLSSLLENWESEFLQMWAFVMLTAYLIQEGSPESRSLTKRTPRIETRAWMRTSPMRLGPSAPAALPGLSIPTP